MFTSTYPVFGQSVRAALGIQHRGNLWLFMERRTELPPWMVLHRESISDTELSSLLFHGSPRSRCGETVDCEVLTHFNLINPRQYRSDWAVGLSEKARNAVFTGQLQVVKLPMQTDILFDLRNPDSLYWMSASRLQQFAAGSAEHERGQAIVEMANILLARWHTQRLEHLDFASKTRVGQMWAEVGAVAQGAGNAAASFIQAIYRLVRVVVTVSADALRATCSGIETVLRGEFVVIQQALQQAGMGLYKTAEELMLAAREGLRLLNLIGEDAALRTALMQFMDGFTESASHLSRIRGTTQVVVEIGIEVLLALATFGASLALSGVRQAVRVGPFSSKLIQHMGLFAKARERTKADR